MTIANVTLTNTFDEWRTRTNQLISLYSETNSLALASFNLSNSSVATAANIAANILTTNATYISIITDTVENVVPEVISSNTIILSGIYDNANVITLEYVNSLNVTVSFDQSNVAINTSVAAFNTANDAVTISSSAFTQANNVGGAVTTANGNITASFNQANLAFTQANNVGGAVTTANSNITAAFGRANSAFTQANLAFTQANNVGGAVTTANSNITAAFERANSAQTIGSSAFTQANLAFTQANNVGGAVTTANSNITAAFERANSAQTIGSSAFSTANAALANTSGVSFNGNLSFPTGNVGIGRTATSNRLDVNGTINAANLLVNGAPLTTGATITSDSVDSVRYVTFANNTTGTFSQANVSTSLIFNPSTGTLSATIFNSTSDAERKTNIETIDNALETVSMLRGVSFNWKDTGRPSYGLVAQEVEQYIPELVETNENGSKTLNYDAVIGFLVEAIKELKKNG